MDMRDAKFYLRQLDLADKEERKWRDRAKKILKKYRDEDPDKVSHFNILWSNTQTQLPALFSARPKPDVRRRWRTENPTGREIATAVERALEFSMDSYDFDRMGEKLVLDILLPGRMVARVRYHPFTTTREVEESYLPGDDIPEDAEEQDDGSFLYRREYEEVVHEDVRCYHVPYDKYRQSPANCWDDVWWVAYGDNFLTKDEIIEQFGEEHSEVPLNYCDDDDEEADEYAVKKAQVWEFWDKEAKKVVAVIKGYDKLLMDEDDPLRLRGFFPQPEPAVLIETANSLIPLPEYTMYQFQAEELNDITERISALTKAMQAKGFYPGDDANKINELMKSSENMLVPVDNWAAFAEKGGMKGMIDWMPIKEIADVWQRLLVQRDQLTNSIYELVGISDIQRGATDPRETRGAQELKANFGSRRLQPKQRRIERFFRDILRIKAEIISEHFSPKTLVMMTGTEVTDEMTAIMRSDALRSFTIDIETDSTVMPDEQAEKQGVSEFLTAMSNYLGQVMPIVQAQPAAVEPLGKMLLWMTRKFKIARDVEQEIEDFIQSFQNMPKAQNVEAEAKAKEIEADIQIRQKEFQAKQQLEEMEAQREQARKDREMEAEIARKDREAEAAIRRENAKAAAKSGIDKAEKEEKSKDNVTPINRKIKLVKDENGKTVAVEVTQGEDTQRIEVNSG